LAPRARDRRQHLDRLLLGDEDAHVARDPGHRREAAADADGEALPSLVDDADERDAVDLRRVAAVGAGGDRVLVLPRQVAEVGVAVEVASRLLDDRRAIEELIGVEALDGTAGDVADRVAAAAGGGEPRRVEVAEDLRQRAELEPVELDVLARRELAVAVSPPVRGLADRAQVLRCQDAARELDPEHERPDLRLVVVEPPPLEADDVLLRDALVAGRDEGRELVTDAERRLLLLDPLDGVSLQDELPGGGRLLA